MYGIAGNTKEIQASFKSLRCCLIQRLYTTVFAWSYFCHDCLLSDSKTFAAAAAAAGDAAAAAAGTDAEARSVGLLYHAGLRWINHANDAPRILKNPQKTIEATLAVPCWSQEELEMIILLLFCY